jgi:hypothetical protein
MCIMSDHPWRLRRLAAPGNPEWLSEKSPIHKTSQDFPAGGGEHMLAAILDYIFYVFFPEKVDISGHCQLS